MRSSQSDASGFIMVVLLIVMGIGAVWMAATLPAWKQQSTREKEAELVFRGRQYVRALSLYERKNGPGTKPTSVDILVDNKFLRKKYKDPMTNDDFQPLFASAAPTAPGQPAGGQAQPGRAGQSPGVGAQPPGVQPGIQPGPGALGAQPGQTPAIGPGAQGGQIVGVVSKSPAPSIMVFAGATHYNEWQFTYQGTPQGGRQGGAPGGPGGVGPGGVGGGQGRGGVPGGTTGGPGRGGPTGPGGVQGPGRGGTPPTVPTGPGRIGRGGT